MKKLILHILLLILCFQLKSQSIEDFRMSNGMINDLELMKFSQEQKYPGYIDRVESLYDDLAQQINDIVEHQNGSRSTIKIPVVIHVVYKTATENISQSIIEDQLDILNRDFQRNNADTVNLRSDFHPVVGNPNIQFLLRHVERVPTTTTFTYDPLNSYDAIKSSSTGGSDAWPTSHYLNIWVGNLSEGFIFGYSTLPYGFINNEDGVVVDYRAFGPSGFFGGYSLEGRTLVHEVGHYLGLNHPWGNVENCTNDDNLNDTPKTGVANYGCDTNSNSCNDGIGDLPDMVENFMEYSADACLITFTEDQAALMRTVVNTYRPNLIPTASIDEKYKGITVNLFPNPSNGIVNYDIIDTEIENIDISVLDLSGKVIHKTHDIPTSGSIDLSILNAGIYIVNVSSNRFVISEKISIE